MDKKDVEFFDRQETLGKIISFLAVGGGLAFWCWQFFGGWTSIHGKLIIAFSFLFGGLLGAKFSEIVSTILLIGGAIAVTYYLFFT
jgi:hypothetical protein